YPDTSSPGRSAVEDAGGMSAASRFVVKPGASGGPPRVERLVRWELIGHVEPELTAEEIGDEFMLGLRDAGIGPEPIVTWAVDDDGDRELRLAWPDLGTHLLDAEFARLVAFASIPLGREIPELDNQPEPDPQHEAGVERL